MYYFSICDIGLGNRPVEVYNNEPEYSLRLPEIKI